MDAGIGYMGASLLGGIFGAAGQNNANAVNLDESERNRKFQEAMSNTAYQRQTNDMRAAGINPMLAIMKGGGASTPTGSTATAGNAGAEMGDAMQGIAQTPTVAAQIKNTKALTGKTQEDTKNVKTTGQILGAEKTIKQNEAKVSSKMLPQLLRNANKSQSSWIGQMGADISDTYQQFDLKPNKAQRIKDFFFGGGTGGPLK